MLSGVQNGDLLCHACAHSKPSPGLAVDGVAAALRAPPREQLVEEDQLVG